MVSENGKESGEKHFVKDELKKIRERSKNASPKIAEYACGLADKIEELGGSSFAYNRVVERIENNFLILRENPQDEVGNGEYDDWTAEDIEELYEVLYGEKMSL